MKIKALRRKFGTTGYAAWNYLLEVMTDSDYFEIDWSELNQELLSADFDLPVEELREIVDYSVRLGLLKLDNEKIFSEALHRRFSGLLSKRKRQLERNIDGENGNQKELSPAKTPQEPAKTPQERVIDDENPKSKVKESKVKESKVNNTPCNPPEGEGASEEKERGKELEKPTTSPTDPTGSAGNTPPGSAAPPSDGERRAKRFVPPTIEEVAAYCAERKNSVSPAKFINYYISNGWRVGKNPMKDWKAAVRTWENNNYNNGTQSQQDTIRIPNSARGEKFKTTI
ncbi:MAG: DUF4373 domain-containing protein [Rikenellaceae bacterium]|nr:DUF4373 domain-containing protein [Rikenellaceae bacterium]